MYKKFIQIEINQKLNLHNKEEYQTFVDKRIIATLEKDFSKRKFALKMKLLINFSTIIPRRTVTIIWREKCWTSVIHSILLILSLFAVQTVRKLASQIQWCKNHQPQPFKKKDQLHTIREEKLEEYLHNYGLQSPSLENNKNNKSSKQCNNLQDKNVDKNQPKKTINQSLW